MAITKLQTGCTLAIEVQKGEDKLGDPIYTKKNFSSVNPKRTPEEVFEVAEAIEKVFANDCRNFFLVDTSKLMKEEA
ncbi:DUF1659 domain-containing protein [Clostridium botulinum]|uniref:DUF1659 domain-containing protein n=1 Tax=Clostridium TaxID=1485 RepID=UPI00077332D6|nr:MULTISPECIES: DUF1659 domain-containing protein [Clostridium]MCS6131124.1 DUF1659 domain-containing protein [Clostridium botulinum]NFH79648.1 DUF1659 domain-containing protein [Clostridium botulinum]NFH82507.1 DUF1659 domain-containing protein [Clostridium botulinum]NFI11232.1 DUF1659 domain-containing protein [Clostridium botulinum]NFI13553.1 DUF1659 domain-containing protein [Clostridium botulinum]